MEKKKHPESVMSTLNYEAMCKLMINHDEILAAPLRILGVSRRISGVRYASPRYNNRLSGKACTAGASGGSDRHVDWNICAKNIGYIVVTH